MKQLKTIKAYRARIAKYFRFIQGEYHIEKVQAKNSKGIADIAERKIWDREPEPATLSGLALALGFTSISELEAYELTGKFAPLIKKARLKVEAEYEKRLHYQSSTGAIFLLKSMGWAERPEDPASTEIPKTFQIEIVDTGLHLSGSEKEVVL